MLLIIRFLVILLGVLHLKENVTIYYWLKGDANIQGPYKVGEGDRILSRQLCQHILVLFLFNIL